MNECILTGLQKYKKKYQCAPGCVSTTEGYVTRRIVHNQHSFSSPKTGCTISVSPDIKITPHPRPSPIERPRTTWPETFHKPNLPHEKLSKKTNPKRLSVRLGKEIKEIKSRTMYIHENQVLFQVIQPVIQNSSRKSPLKHLKFLARKLGKHPVTHGQKTESV